MLTLFLGALFQAGAGDLALSERTASQATAGAAAERSPANDTASEEAEGDGRRCRREVIVGTRLSQRICTTAAQRREMEEHARRQLERGRQTWTPPES